MFQAAQALRYSFIHGLISDSVVFIHAKQELVCPFMPGEVGGGLLPYMGYVGMCGPKGYGFQPFWS